MERVLGALGATYEFSGWTDADTRNPSSTVTMDEPKLVTARWTPNPTVPLVIIAVILIAIFLAYKRGYLTSLRKSSMDTGKTQQPPDTAALEILNERFAKGEITSKEYHTMKKELEG